MQIKATILDPERGHKVMLMRPYTPIAPQGVRATKHLDFLIKSYANGTLSRQLQFFPPTQVFVLLCGTCVDYVVVVGSVHRARAGRLSNGTGRNDAYMILPYHPLPSYLLQ